MALKEETGREAAASDLIPVFQPSMSEREISAVAEVLRSRWTGTGARVAALEASFARAVGVPHAISTNSGTAALLSALWGLGVGPGDQVIIPSFTYISVFQMLRRLEVEPVFADIDPLTLTIDPADVAARVTSRTKGIVVVHHGGQLVDMDALARLARDAGIWLIEDCAHAAGATYHGRPAGSLADAACFSFNAVKNLSSGDGGMVTTADGDIAKRVATYRGLGIDKDTWVRYGAEFQPEQKRWFYDIVGPGMRLNMNDITGAIALVQLERLAEMNGARSRRVKVYEAAFDGISAVRTIKPRTDTEPSWHMYTMLMDDRDGFVDRMREKGVTIGIHYYPIHLYDIAQAYRVPLPVTEELWQRVITFPLFPDMTDAQQDKVIEASLDSLSSA